MSHQQPTGHHHRTRVAPWLEAPLLHFTVLGLLVFGLERMVASDPPSVLQVDDSKRQELSALFEQRQGQKPTPNQLEQLVARWQEEEALFHEAISLDLMRQDAVLRDQLIGRMRGLLQASSAPPQPSEVELEDYLRLHHERYQASATVSFTEYYVPAGSRADDVARHLLIALQTGRTVEATSVEHTQRPATDLSALYGSSWLAKLTDAPLETWVLLRSAAGLHVVKVHARSPARQLSLNEARQRLINDWRAEQTQHVMKVRLNQIVARWQQQTAEAEP